jgi:hypothetical protein
MNAMPVSELIDRVVEICKDIIKIYDPLFEKLKEDVERYYR